MGYPGNIGSLKLVPLGRTIDGVQSGGYGVSEDALLQSVVLFEVSETVRLALEQTNFNQIDSQLAADIVYEDAYLAAIARWAVNPTMPTSVRRIFESFSHDIRQ